MKSAISRRQTCSKTQFGIGMKQYFRHGPYHEMPPICALPSRGITAHLFVAGFGVSSSNRMCVPVVEQGAPGNSRCASPFIVPWFIVPFGCAQALPSAAVPELGRWAARSRFAVAENDASSILVGFGADQMLAGRCGVVGVAVVE